jgi:hypothetical protein
MRLRTNPARLQQFLDNYTHRVPGVSIPFAEFAARFRAWCPPSERWWWTDYKLSRALRDDHEVGSLARNVKHIGNLSWTPGSPSGEFVSVSGNKQHGAARRLHKI